MSVIDTAEPRKFTYEGKFVDRFPNHPYAGKNSTVGRETVAHCLKFPPEPPLPDNINRLKQWVSTPLEQHRIFHAQVHDPELQRARSMVHGIDYPPGPGAADLVNPIPQSVYQQRFTDKLESIYQTHKKKPLGRTPDATEAFPENVNYKDLVFGIKSAYDINIKELLNPDKSFASLAKEQQFDHDYYLKSHKRVYPGEQSKRGYSANPRFSKIDYFGVPTPCNHEGLLTKSCLRWHTDKENERKTPLVEKRLDDYREKYTHQIGKPLDPIKDTRIVNPDHRYGSVSKPDLYQVADLIHGKIPHYFNTGPLRERAVIGAIRNQLRSLYYTHYKDLYDSCLLLDNDKSGLLPLDDTKAVCQQLDVPLDPQLLEQALDICHVKGMIDWRKFCEIFNWHERINFDDIKPDFSHSSDPCESNLNDWTLQNRLQREVEKDLANWTTTNSMYNGGGILKNKKFPTLGAPSVRTDLAIPKIRKATDKKCYGDEGGARCVMNPSIMTIHGITEMDLLLPRTKQECREFYNSLYPNGGIVPFERIWDRCIELTTDKPINIDVFKSVLLEYENARIRENVEKEIPMLEGCKSNIFEHFKC